MDAEQRPQSVRPALVETAVGRLGEAAVRRLLVVLRVPGCTWPAQPRGGCPVCGSREPATDGAPVTAAEYTAQIEAALDGRDLAAEGVHEVDLHCSGSLLNDAEVSPAARAAVLGRLAAEPAVRHVLVESRPEYVTPETIRTCRAALRPEQTLEVAIGLESADDHVREELANAGFDRAAFERAAAALADAHAPAAPVRLLARVLVKPPGLTESAALRDSVASGRYVLDLGRRLGIATRIALRPMFVVPDTPAAVAFAAGQYRPPSLWTVVAIIRRLHGEAPADAILVELSDESLAPAGTPGACGRCRGALHASLARYNERGDPGVFGALGCDCLPRLV